MTSPVLMAIRRQSRDPQDTRWHVTPVRTRHLIISESSPETALGRLRDLRAADRPVAVVFAASTLASASAPELLAQVHRVHPSAKRALIVPRGGQAAPSLRVPIPLVLDRRAGDPVLRAMAHGMMDAYLSAPGAGRDEGFHRAVSELLEEWSQQAEPALPAVRIIAQPQSATPTSCTNCWLVRTSRTSFMQETPLKASRCCGRHTRRLPRSQCL